MSAHPALDLLSSYLDAEITPAQLRLVEEHLGECHDCRRTVDGFRAVAQGVRRLESVAPPTTLAANVERRVQRAALEKSAGLRLEESLKRWMGQPVLAPVFAVVLALGAILYLFASGVAKEDSQRTRFVIAAAPSETAVETSEDSTAGSDRLAASPRADEAPEADDGTTASRPSRQVHEGARLKALGYVGEIGEGAGGPAAIGALADASAASAAIREISGRRFRLDGDVWMEEGVDLADVDEVLDLRSGDAEPDPALEPFRELGRLRFQLEDRVVEVLYPEPGRSD